MSPVLTWGLSHAAGLVLALAVALVLLVACMVAQSILGAL